MVWANVLVGRMLFSSLQNEQMLEKLQEILQRKLNSIKVTMPRVHHSYLGVLIGRMFRMFLPLIASQFHGRCYH